MNVTVKFETQVKRAAGTSSREMEVDPAWSVGDIVRHLAEGSEPLREILVDCSGEVRSMIVLFLDDEHVSPETPLTEGAVLTLMSPISGG
jgi:molybdopterin converting factor small subunit